jgi:hypothetical protein
MSDTDTILRDNMVEALKAGMAESANIKDERSFQWWLETLGRETKTTNVSGDYREVSSWRYFENGDNASMDAAKREVCSDMYFKLSADLKAKPSGKIVWRREPEFDITLKDLHPLFKGYMRYKIVD